MNSFERVRAAIRRGKPDRVPRSDHFWEDARRDLLAQAGWHPDGDVADLFDHDLRDTWWDASPRLDRKTITEDDREIIIEDEWGRTVRSLRHEQTTGEHIAFAVTSHAIWRERFRDRFRWVPERIDVDRMTRLQAYWRKAERYIAWSCLDPFEATWMKCGPVGHLEAYVEDVDWVRDMYGVHTELVEAGFADMIARGLKPDGVWFWADVAYKNGPMISPAMYREILMPFHKRLTAMAHAAGCDTIFHSDGDLHALFPHLIEAGFDCFHPLEVKANMDVRELKRLYGDRAAFMGNIDARLFQTNDLAGLEREIRDKVTAAKAGGGYLYHSDHSVPPGVTLATYRRAMELLDHYGRER